VRPKPHPPFTPLIRPKTYQGTSFRSPFFFLLLDSFLESLLCASPGFAASVASLFVSVPAAAASLFASAPAASGFAPAGVSVAAAAVGGAEVFGASVAAVGAELDSLGVSVVAGAVAGVSVVVASLPAGATFPTVAPPVFVPPTDTT
jgi:hypothetical protein